MLHIAGFLSAPFRYAQIVVLIWQIHIIPVTILLILFTVVAYTKRQPGALPVSISVTLFGICAVVETVISALFRYELNISRFAFIALVTSLSFMTISRFLELRKETETFSEQLTAQRNSFYRFVPKPLMELLGKSTGTDLDAGNNSLRTVSVMFADIRSFTHLAETMNPQETFDFINNFMANMEPTIQGYSGFVDKFLGDGIMALFPESDDRHKPVETRITSADRSVGASVAMHEKLQEYNRRRQKEGHPPIEIRIGINTGDVIVGTIGSASRMDITVLGDTVNVASRLESLAENFQLRILISENTLRHLTHRDQHFIRKVGITKLKGKTNTINLYEVFDNDPQEIRQLKSQAEPILIRAFQEISLKQYQSAQEMMAEAFRKNPGDKVLGYYIALCESERRNSG